MIEHPFDRSPGGKLAQRLAENLEIVARSRHVPAAVSLANFPRLAELTIGVSVPTGEEMQSAQLMQHPRFAEWVFELLSSLERGAQRAQQLDPAPEQGEQGGQATCDSEYIVPALCPVQPL
ncbi:MAG: hypothetical protein WAU42_01235 [Solirubrobacteraceae bacterium]